MLIIIGDAPATLLSTQITKLSNNNSYPIFYDNGTNEDNYAEFTKLSNNSARLTCRHSAANQFRGWRNIAIIY